MFPGSVSQSDNLMTALGGGCAWYPGTRGIATQDQRWEDREPAVTNEEAIDRAVVCVLEGGVVAHPTSTLYGWGGRARGEINSLIASLKRRAPRPLINLVSDPDMVRRSFPDAQWTSMARDLAASFWPGPLTLVLDTGSGAGVAVRVDGHPVVNRLLELLGEPLTSTSLNIAGEPPARTSRQARALMARVPHSLADRVGWLDAGDLPPSPPSTLVRVGKRGHEILRTGAIDSGQLREALGG